MPSTISTRTHSQACPVLSAQCCILPQTGTYHGLRINFLKIFSCSRMCNQGTEPQLHCPAFCPALRIRIKCCSAEVRYTLSLSTDFTIRQPCTALGLHAHGNVSLSSSLGTTQMYHSLCPCPVCTQVGSTHPGTENSDLSADALLTTKYVYACLYVCIQKQNVCSMQHDIWARCHADGLPPCQCG